MAYADQQMSGNKIVTLVIVALLHIALIYALVTGLAYSAFKKIKDVTTAVKIDPDKPPPPPPPPPPKTDTPPPPPIVAPPPAITFNAPAPVLQTVTAPPPIPAPPAAVVIPAPPAPPPPKFTAKAATPKGRPGDWASDSDYPSRALQLSQEGVTGFHVSVGTDGKVTSCEITKSSGSPELDKTTCAVVTRRARFNPATDGDGNPTTGSFSNSVRWQIPKD
ncbi:energy transducer TonB [Novosphingobium sp.]|uniref:energy transducer TonB n=1 Tax=Novosphingobium sp. TaxID=1874826 RepID=UPI003B51A470